MAKVRRDTQGFTGRDERTGSPRKDEQWKGEVVLEKYKVMIRPRDRRQNLKYWTAQSNDGFRMWKSKHEEFEARTTIFL